MAGGTSFGVALALFASSRTFPLSLALVALAGALQAGALAEHFGAPWAVGGMITALAMAVAAWRVVELGGRRRALNPRASAAPPASPPAARALGARAVFRSPIARRGSAGAG